MTRALPKGWIKTSLAEVCLPVATVRPSDSPGMVYTYFDIGGVDNKTNTVAETKKITGQGAPSRARQAIQKNDILFSTVRTYLLNIAIVEQDYPNPVASTGFAVIRPAEGISTPFLFYQVLSDEFIRPLNALQSGSSYPAVRVKDVFDRPILLPPSQEQQRIAAKLTTAFSALSRAESAATRALNRVGRYRTSVLNAAVTGELTRDWRNVQKRKKTSRLENGEAVLKRLLEVRRARWESAELKHLQSKGTVPKNEKWKSRYPTPTSPDARDFPTIPTDWAWASLEMVAEIGSGVTVSQNRAPKDFVDVPYLRVANVLRGSFDLREIKRIRIERNRFQQYVLQKGDVLFTEGGDRDKLGRGWVWEGQIKKCVHQNHVFRARLIDQTLLSPRLVSHWGNTFGQHFFLIHAIQTTNLASINRGVLCRLPVPIPTVAEQTEIMRDLDHRLAAAARLETRLKEQLVRADKARQSLLQEAFRGKLVPQNPEDEPVSILLDRISATRGVASRKSKSKRVERMPKSRLRRQRRLSLLETLRAQKKPITPEHLFSDAGFEASHVDLFYRELNSLRPMLNEIRSTGTKAKSWPSRSAVFLQLKSGTKK